MENGRRNDCDRKHRCDGCVSNDNTVRKIKETNWPSRKLTGRRVINNQPVCRVMNARGFLVEVDNRSLNRHSREHVIAKHFAEHPGELRSGGRARMPRRDPTTFEANRRYDGLFAHGDEGVLDRLMIAVRMTKVVE